MTNEQIGRSQEVLGVRPCSIRWASRESLLSKRRADLAAEIEAVLQKDFKGRILSFDSEAAQAYAEIAGNRRRAGKPISQSDAQIAAIARARGADLATRNVADFTGCGIVVINPWTATRH